MNRELVFQTDEQAKHFLREMACEVSTKAIQEAEVTFVKKYTYCTDGMIGMGLRLVEEAVDTLGESARLEVASEIGIIHGYLGRIAPSLGEIVEITGEMGVGEVLAHTCRNLTIEELKQLMIKMGRNEETSNQVLS